MTPSDSLHTLMKRKISLLDANGNLIVCGENDYRFDAERKDNQKLILYLTRQDILDKKSEYLPDDKLCLLCEYSFSIGLEFEKIAETQHEILNMGHRRGSYARGTSRRRFVRRYSSRYPTVYLNASETSYIRHTNVELKTKTKSFPAHRIVLCAASSVFNTMIKMADEDTAYIRIDDLEDDIVEQILCFLYSGKIENLRLNTATQLYYAAIKYQIEKLKYICSSFLVENLNTSNASQLLVQADAHGDSDLKNSVEDFILEHEEQVFGSKEWEMLMETSPELAAKTMHLKFKRRGEMY